MNKHQLDSRFGAGVVGRLGVAVRGLVRLALSLTLVVLLTSCHTTSDSITYFQDADRLADTLPLQTQTVTIRPQDELRIIVSAESSEAVAVFNKPVVLSRQAGDRGVSAQALFQSYIVDDKGDITFPTLGQIHAAGLTTIALGELLTQRISQYVKDPIVTVDPINFQVQVLGEVNSPGTVYLAAHRSTLLDAIAAARDLTIYGDRTSILVIHREGDHMEKHRVNLTQSDALTDPFCNLHQDDIVYVAPNQARRDSSRYNSMKQQNLSVISTVVGLISMLSTLAIAIWK